MRLAHSKKQGVLTVRHHDKAQRNADIYSPRVDRSFHVSVQTTAIIIATQAVIFNRARRGVSFGRAFKG